MFPPFLMVWYPLWLKTAAVEDRATQGCDLSATGGPKLAGVALGSLLPVIALWLASPSPFSGGFSFWGFSLP
jgi:hypothetical protein